VGVDTKPGGGGGGSHEQRRRRIWDGGGAQSGKQEGGPGWGWRGHETENGGAGRVEEVTKISKFATITNISLLKIDSYCILPLGGMVYRKTTLLNWCQGCYAPSTNAK
jgi:hypothetical protein